MEIFAIFGCIFLLVCAGLMLRFIFGCTGQMKAATTSYQVFTVIIRLLLGIAVFPLTIFVQALDVAFGD
jgi:hypothetical protein